MRVEHRVLGGELGAALGERERLAQANPQWRSLRLRLSTAKDAEIRLSYRVPQAGWAPGYRALLDTEEAAFESLEHSASIGDRQNAEIDLELWRRAAARREAFLTAHLPMPMAISG